MFRVSVMSSGVYAKECSLADYGDREDIEEITREGEPVILVDDLEDLGAFNIEGEDITMVEGE